MKTGKKFLSALLVVVMCITSIPLIGFDFKAEATEYSVGDIIEFGSYPQTQVTDSSLISALNSISATWRSYDYMSGSGTGWCDGSAKESDYMKYKDVTYNNERYRAVEFSTYRPGLVTFKSTESCFSHQADNGYTINNVYWFKFEPIQWRILDPSKGLVLCNSVIDSQAFNNNLYATGNTSTWWADYWKDSARTIHANNYAESDIKEWLNDDFYYTAFTEANRKIINTQTDGKICLLTRSDTTNTAYGFINDESRKAYGTDYAKAQGLRVSNGTSIWMTQSAASSLGINISCVHFDGHTFDRESNDYGHTSMTFHGVRPAMCVDLDAVTSKKIFPEGYNFETCKYPFKNQTGRISLDKYPLFFGPIYGAVISSIHANSAGDSGTCFGMATTTGSLIKKYYDINNISYKDSQGNKITARQICDIWNGTLGNPDYFISGLNMTVSDYIDYGYLYQWGPWEVYAEAIIMGTVHMFDQYNKLYNQVYNFVYNDGSPVVICFDGDLKHAVLAVGIEEDCIDDYGAEYTKIIIDDSNYLTERELRLYKNDSGEYYTWAFSFDENTTLDSWNTTLSFRTPCYMFSEAIEYMASGTMYNSYNAVNLIKVDKDVSIESLDNLLKNLVIWSPSTFRDNTQTTTAENNSDKLYWLDNSYNKPISFSSDHTNCTIEFANYYSSISIELPYESKCNVSTTSDNFIQSYFSKVKNKTISIKNTEFNNNGQKLELAVSGVAISDVDITQTETGLVVTGIEDGTITLSKNDEVISTQTITDAESDIEITYDKNGDDDKLDVEYETSSSDESTNPTDNCSCKCHKTGFFAKLIWKITIFFQKLFKKNAVCTCGVAHY